MCKISDKVVLHANERTKQGSLMRYYESPADLSEVKVKTLFNGRHYEKVIAVPELKVSYGRSIKLANANVNVNVNVE